MNRMELQEISLTPPVSSPDITSSPSFFFLNKLQSAQAVQTVVFYSAVNWMFGDVFLILAHDDHETRGKDSSARSRGRRGNSSQWTSVIKTVQ